MIGSFGDDHTEMLFIEGTDTRITKNFTQKFTSDKGIIKKAYKKLFQIYKANSLEELNSNTPGSELEKKKNDEKNGDVYCMRIDNQYRLCFRESYDENGNLVVKELEISKHYKNSKLFPEGYKS